MVTLVHSRKRLKGERLVARVSPADKAIISKAAALLGQSAGSFMVVTARKAAEETLEARERFVLSAAESRRFVAALLARPRAPTARMKRALKLHRQTVSTN